MDEQRGIFTERELRLISNCLHYAKNDPAGLPGHNLALIVAKFAKLSTLPHAFEAQPWQRPPDDPIFQEEPWQLQENS